MYDIFQPHILIVITAIAEGKNGDSEYQFWQLLCSKNCE